jgi:hypothetical protein
VFPVKYGLNSYMPFRRKSVFKGLILSQLTLAAHCVLSAPNSSLCIVVTTVRSMLPHLTVTFISKTKRLSTCVI